MKLSSAGTDGLFESRTLFDASPDPIMVATPAGEVLAANPAACALLGWSEGELCRMGRAGVVDQSDPRVVEAMADRIRTGRFRGELTFRRASGETLPVELSTSVFPGPRGDQRTLLIFRDITDRLRTEAALRVSEERFAKAFRTSPDGITISGLSDGRYLEVNAGFTSLSGYPAWEVLGRTSVELGVWLRPEDRKAFADTLRDRGEVVNLEVDFRFKGGVIKHTLVSARTMELNGEACILSTTRDMTEKVRLAETLLRTQKLESLGLLAGGIAHDFNNLLAGLFGFLELARNSVAAGQPEKAPSYLDRALSVFGRARGLTQQLLTFAKGGAPIRKTLPLEPLLRHNAAFALSGSNVTAGYAISPDLWPCEGDEDQLAQVVDNLVLNAKQAMPDGGSIQVTARNRPDPPGHPGAFVQVSFRDEGRGIAPEHLPRIFDPFFSTKETGHGLGLATVFSIVRRHDGWIDVESEPGRGACFHVFLPAAAGPVSEASASPAAGHRGTGAILLLDDEEVLREVLGDQLTALGYRTVACAGGAEAVRLYREALDRGDPFAAAILDLTIPGGYGGAEVARNLKALHPQAVLIAASGYSDCPPFQHPGEHGFSGLLAKPSLKEDLGRLLARLLPG